MTDMITFLNDRGIDTYDYGSRRDKHIARGWVQMACPICGGSHLWLGYNREHDYFVCFNHGHARLYTLLRAWFPNEDTYALLRQIDRTSVQSNIIQSNEPVSGSVRPPDWVLSLRESPEHVAYIQRRGLDVDTLSLYWKIGAICACPEHQYMNRVFIPVHDASGRFVSWLTRSIESENRYRYIAASPERESVPLKSMLYGEQYMNMYKPLIVCEGVFDALRIGRNAVATFGKKITRAQFDRIRQYRRRVICFDGERDTQEQALELMRELSVYPGVTENVCLDAPDPGSADPVEIDKLLEHIGAV